MDLIRSFIRNDFLFLLILLIYSIVYNAFHLSLYIYIYIILSISRYFTKSCSNTSRFIPLSIMRSQIRSFSIISSQTRNYVKVRRYAPETYALINSILKVGSFEGFILDVPKNLSPRSIIRGLLISDIINNLKSRDLLSDKDKLSIRILKEYTVLHLSYDIQYVKPGDINVFLNFPDHELGPDIYNTLFFLVLNLPYFDKFSQKAIISYR